MKINLRSALKSLEHVHVSAHWDPIADATFNLHKKSRQHIELFNLSPNHSMKEYRGDDFEVFLPSSVVEMGSVWKLDSDGVLPFLRQFHPGATTDLRQGTEGAFACLRAYSSEYADITFRVHADFVLESPIHQEWQRENAVGDYVPRALFIPAQFTGHILIHLKKGTICAFSMALPSRNSNVDINAFGHADMVFVPRMELIARDTAETDDITWETAITQADAFKSLKSKFYKFAEINWLPIDEVVELAKLNNRPIHAVLVWGALDDESC